MEPGFPLSFFLLFMTIAIVGILAFFFWMAYQYNAKRSKKPEMVPSKKREQQQEDDLDEELEQERNWVIHHEIDDTNTCLKNEEAALAKILGEIKNLEAVFNENETHLISEQTRERYEESMEQLKLRQKLRTAKIRFYQQYLKKWRVKAAIERAESLLLSEAEEEDAIAYKKVAQVEPGNEKDFLRLRPLSERMKLCESEMEANLILEELEILMRKD